jgi:Fe(3+) dicitrate transport protein
MKVTINFNTVTWAVVLVLLGAPIARGEEPSDGGFPLGREILVTEADGTPRVAGSAHKVDEEALERFEHNNIEQILGQVPGISTRGEDGHGLRPNIGIRGANSDRSAKITLMEDGVLFAPAPYAAPATYFFPMSTRMVAIEVFKGPAATRHGPQTVGGALNLVTRDIPEGPAHATDLAVGSHGTVKAHAWAGRGGDRFGILGEGVHLQSVGFKALDGGGDTGFERSELMLKTRWQPVAAHRAELKLGLSREDSRETYLGLTLGDWEATPYRRYAASSLGHMQWTRTQAELAWDARLARRLNLRTVAYHHFFDRTWTKFSGFSGDVDMLSLMKGDSSAGTAADYLAVLRGEADTTGADDTLVIATKGRQYHSYGLQSGVRWEVPGAQVTSTLDAGIRLHVDRGLKQNREDAHRMISGQLEADGSDPLVKADSQILAQAVAAHVHEDLRIRKLHLLPGVRVEVVQGSAWTVGEEAEPAISRTTVLPGMGLLAELGDWTHAFAGSHRGFSPVAPGQAEEVNPELSWNHEVGMRWTVGERLVEGVAFFNDYSNITGQCTQSGGCSAGDVGEQFNGGQAWIYGAEAVAEDSFSLAGEGEVQVALSYAWTQTRFLTSFSSAFSQFGDVVAGDGLPYVPAHQGGGTVAHVGPRGEISLGLTARSGMLDTAGPSSTTAMDIPALLLLDAAGKLHLGHDMSLYATATNLTGTAGITSWRPMGIRPTPPLQVMLGLTWKPEADAP